MRPLYAKGAHSLKCFFALAFVLLALGACSGGYGGGSPWGMTGNKGMVTKDPQSLPDIAWQTSHQRRDLAQEDADFARQAEGQGPAGAFAKPQPVRVAMLLPLSGQHAAIGQAMLKAAQMALFDVGSATYQLVPHDTRGTPAGAAEAARRAAGERTDLILGPIFAEDVRAVKPIAQSARIPVIAFTTDWTLAGDDTYIMGFLPFAQVTRVTQYAQSRGLSKFAVFAPQTEYCDVVIGTLQRSGAQIVRAGRYAPGDTQLAKLVEEFATQGRLFTETGEESFVFDTLLLPVGGESLRALVSLFDQHGVNNQKVRLIGTGLWDDDSLTRNPALYGGLFAAPDPALRRDFEKRYRENYGEEPPRLATLAYDATALSAVLSRHPANGKTYARERLTNPRGFAGIDGIFRFRPDGLSERGLAVLEIQSGRPRVVDPAPTAFIPGT